MQYQLGVVLMQQGRPAEAASAYEETLRMEPSHHGALVNGVHTLQQLPPDEAATRRRIEKVAKMGVKAGLWRHWMQRPPHLLPGLRSQPWWDKRAFPWCALLEQEYVAIREEVLALRSVRTQPFTL